MRSRPCSQKQSETNVSLIKKLSIVSNGLLDRVNWTSKDYQHHVRRNVLPDLEHEDLLMRKFEPLIDLKEFLARKDGQLPIVAEPAVFTDLENNTLGWSLPDVLPDRRQVGAMPFCLASVPH